MATAAPEVMQYCSMSLTLSNTGSRCLPQGSQNTKWAGASMPAFRLTCPAAQPEDKGRPIHVILGTFIGGTHCMPLSSATPHANHELEANCEGTQHNSCRSSIW